MARQLVVELVGRSQQFTKALDTAAERTEAVGQKMQKVGKKMTTFVTLPILGAGAAAFKMASDLTESLNAVDIAFGKDAKEVQAWAKNLNSAFGFTQRDALDAVASFQLVAKGAGFTGKQMTALAERAADMGSVFNVSSAEAAAAIKSGLVGETEPLRRFGVVLTQAAIEAKAVALGLEFVAGKMTPAAKQAATYALIMEQTAIAQGDATKTADTAAGQLRVLKADAGRAAETLGMKLLPIGMKILGFVTDLVDGFTKLSPQMQNNILIAAGLAAAIGPLVSVIGSLTVALAFLAANPLVLVAAAVAALTLAVIAAKKGWITFPDPIREALNVALFVVRTMVDNILRQLDWILSAAATAFGWIPGLGPKLRAANAEFDQFRAGVVGALGPIREEARTVEDALDRLRDKGAVIGVGGRGAPGAIRRHTGGVVPGTTGHPVPIMALGGETVGRNGGGGGTTTIQLVLDGRVVTEVVHEGLLGRQRRSGNLGFAAA